MTKYYDAGDIDLGEEVVLDHTGRRITEARARNGPTTPSAASLASTTGRRIMTRRTSRCGSTFPPKPGSGPLHVRRPKASP
jgi:hypothetical protein